MQREYNSQDCIISFLYIKPQLPPYWLFRDAVVLYRFSTSNHNCTYIYALVLVLYYIVSLHQTTTERALNRRFFLRNRQIYIESESDDRHPCLYFQAEGKPPTFLNPRMTLWMDGEVPSKPNFTIFVPNFLVSSLNSEEDRHKGRHLAEIIRIVELYKPAGRRYHINIYEYE